MECPIAYLVLVLALSLHTKWVIGSSIYPFQCNPKGASVSQCQSYLYSSNNPSSINDIATLYNVSLANLRPASQGNNYLISVKCSCQKLDDFTSAFLANTKYQVQSGDTFANISSTHFNSQAWTNGDQNMDIPPNTLVEINLVCGCVREAEAYIVTYTVRPDDTLYKIAEDLSSDMAEIERLNSRLIKDRNSIEGGWVLFVPVGSSSNPGNGDTPRTPTSKKWSHWEIIIAIAASVTIVSLGVLLWFCFWSRIVSFLHKSTGQAEIKSKISSTRSVTASRDQYILQENVEGVEPIFSSERPIIFSLEEVERSTANFHETKQLGEGSYGRVFYGTLRNQEVAIKKMKASKSREFFAELKVLCKVHHINVVELIGFSSGDEHLYLVYEYVQNGSLSNHLHDVTMNGYQPLSWNARVQIALDAARGLEYIHDHTRTSYVHRDVKTSNILLDGQFRAKVADFGLVKLVEHVGEIRRMATRVVGTPGYLAPEYVHDGHVTSKCDVFAFGVVLAELITGQHALIRSNREPNKMRSLITVVHGIFEQSEPKVLLEGIIDPNLADNYPIEEVCKMAVLAKSCLEEDPINRPEMREIVFKLSQLLLSSIEWEASLGGSSQIFSGLINGR